MQLLPSRERLEVRLGFAHERLELRAGHHEFDAIPLIGDVGNESSIRPFIRQMREERLEQPSGEELPLVSVEVDHQRLGISEGILGYRHHFSTRNGLHHVVAIEHVGSQAPNRHDRCAVLVGIHPWIGQGADRLVQLEGVVRCPRQLHVVEHEAELLKESLCAESLWNLVGFAEHINHGRISRYEFGGMTGETPVFFPGEGVRRAVSGQHRHVQCDVQVLLKVQQCSRWRRMARCIDGQGPFPRAQVEDMVHHGGFTLPNDRSIE